MKVLFGVFDWGLGHATRDSPLIEALLQRGDRVDIISTGRALKLLQGKFEKRCNYFDVPSIYVPYGKSRFFVLKFAFSIPKMLSTLKKARKISRKIVEEGNYDKVISDCRYDVYDKKDNSFLINHQLKFKSPIGEFIAEYYLASAMNHYGMVFVPDFPERKLTGELSFNKRFSGKVEYIGILSHIKKSKIKEDIDYFFSISGPEPQRTLFEKKVIEQIKDLKGSIVVAGGNPDAKTSKKNKNIRFFSFLVSNKQEEIMNRAKTIITRSGYTTVMELVELGKKNVLFVPTPGMTEQEYLADIYEKEKLWHHVHQDDFDLKEDLKSIGDFRGYEARWRTKDSVRRFVELISEN